MDGQVPTNAQAEEFKQTIDIFAKVTWRAYRRQIPLEDLKQAGNEGLCQAIQRWDPTKPAGASLRTFANRRIEGAIKDCARQEARAHKYSRELRADRSFEAAASDIDSFDPRDTEPPSARESFHSLRAVLFRAVVGYVAEDVESGTPETAYETKEEIATVEKYLDELSPRERECIKLRWFENLSNGEIAARLKIAPSTVSHFRDNGERRLRAMILGNEG